MPEATKGDFVKVPRWLIDSMLLETLTGADIRVLLVLIEQTYGWRKPFVEASFEEIAKRANLSKSAVRSAVLRLEDVFITRESGRYKSFIYGWDVMSLWDTVLDEAHRTVPDWYPKPPVNLCKTLRELRACKTHAERVEVLERYG